MLVSKKLSFCVLIFCLCLTLILSGSSNVLIQISGSPRTAGTIIYDYQRFYRKEAAGDPYGIEWAMNISSVDSAYTSILSETTYRFDISAIFDLSNVYQIRSSITYYPSHYGIRYYNDQGNLLGTSNFSLPTLSISSVVYQIKRDDGECVLAQKPFGAIKFSIGGYFESTSAYSFVGYPFDLTSVGDKYSGLFHPNASTWQIGDIVNEYCTITGEGVYKGYKTWIVERNEVPEGYSVFNTKEYFEQTTGLSINGNMKAIKPNELYHEGNYHIREQGALWWLQYHNPITSSTTGKEVDALIQWSILLILPGMGIISLNKIRRRR